MKSHSLYVSNSHSLESHSLYVYMYHSEKEVFSRMLRDLYSPSDFNKLFLALPSKQKIEIQN